MSNVSTRKMPFSITTLWVGATLCTETVRIHAGLHTRHYFAPFTVQNGPDILNKFSHKPNHHRYQASHSDSFREKLSREAEKNESPKMRSHRRRPQLTCHRPKQAVLKASRQTFRSQMPCFFDPVLGIPANKVFSIVSERLSKSNGRCWQTNL